MTVFSMVVPSADVGSVVLHCAVCGVAPCPTWCCTMPCVVLHHALRVVAPCPAWCCTVPCVVLHRALHGVAPCPAWCCTVPYVVLQRRSALHAPHRRGVPPQGHRGRPDGRRLHPTPDPHRRGQHGEVVVVGVSRPAARLRAQVQPRQRPDGAQAGGVTVSI